MVKIRDIINQIDTVSGVCPQCHEEAILVAIISDYYRCTNCGGDKVFNIYLFQRKIGHG
jgi:uncharacterized protein (DUF983 family)